MNDLAMSATLRNMSSQARRLMMQHHLTLKPD
eukprot:CAMPEP_0171095298 /NCGR_PEP_ID=MMETSP0766_2-20121228/43096_1 /TAXON_ID=439317 /ORGANISM="Gambierdiscus australes, Strain CAWD 149" /LENGTH=31 /DNA_ID= /DNA_START= /DNA_END= /DNA_ORIENTATION=